MAAFSEVIKMTAIPSGVDSTRELLYLSVVLSPELSGGGGTLAGTDFENWPNTLMGYTQNNWDNHYYPADWDVVVSDGSGSTLFQEIVPLDASGTDPALWGSLFPSSTSYEEPDSSQSRSLAKAKSGFLADDRFRAVPIISFPITQLMDFVTGQYQQYSPTEPPDFETISAVYAPVTAGLVGVVGEQHAEALARERQARSRGGTVAHANDFTDASTSEAYAAYTEYQQASATPGPPAGVGPIDFHAALAFIGQHGVLQRALGLVFDIAVPYGGNAAAENIFSGTTGVNSVYVSVSLYASSYGFSSNPQPSSAARAVIPSGSPGFDFTQVCPRTQCDANSTTFTATSVTGNINEGLLLGEDPSQLKPVPLDIIGDVNSTSNLVYKLRTIQRADAKKGDYSGSDFIPYTGLIIPPPSLRSAGITLAQVSAGLNLADQLVRSYAASDAAADGVNSGDGSQLFDYAAEDLVRGYVLDVLDLENNVWRSTGERNVTYTSGSARVSDGRTSEPFDEAAVQAPPHLVIPPNSSIVQFTLSEIILTYNGWSNAVTRPGLPLVDSDSTLPPTTPPFVLTIADSVPDGRLPPLRFGHSYRMRVRVIDVANNKASVSDPATNRQFTDPIFYGRLEPIPPPDIYSQSIPRLGESLKRLVIRDIDLDTPSVRAVYPQRVSGQFAEAHGLFDNSSGDPAPGAYTTIVPRESGQYPDPPSDATTQPPTIALDDPVPFLPDPLARRSVLFLNFGTGEQQSFTADFSPQNGASWPNYRPYGLELTAGSAIGASVDQNQRVITFTLTPADEVAVRMTATCDTGDVPLLGMPQLFKGGTGPTAADAADIAAGGWWAITPETDLKLTYAVQKPLATPEFDALRSERYAGQLDASISGNLTWSPKSTAEVDIVAAWSEPVDDPALNLLQGPGTPNPALREISNSPVATVSEGNTNQLGGTTQIQTPDGDQLNATDPLSFDHKFLDTKHRVVTYSGVATSAFAECYPDGTPMTVSTAKPVTVNILSTAPPEPPAVIGVIPIYDWTLEDAHSKIISERGPSALRVFLARPWWTSGAGELLAVLNAGANEHASFAADIGVSDWAADPVFSSAVLPSAHPGPASFPNAVNSSGGIAGHAVTFDAVRDTWYCDIKVDTGAAYTPMIRLALARWQPDSLDGVALSKVVMTQIMSLDPGRTLTIVRGGGGSLSSVQLTGYSYSRAAAVDGSGPGIAQLQVQRRDSSIDDETLGWELVGAPIQMRASRPSTEPATWTARDVQLPGSGPHRIVVTQYEMLPGGDSRPLPVQSDDVTYSQPEPGREYRLMHQDIVQV
jgi:hypothetical protein